MEAQAVDQHLLNPVPERLLLLHRSPELELSLCAGANELCRLLIADRGRIDGGLDVEERLRQIQLLRGCAGAKAQAPPPARQLVSADNTLTQKCDTFDADALEYWSPHFRFEKGYLRWA